MVSSSVRIVTHRIFVSGKVQGVFYRKYTQKSAVERELTGWVRNLPDGRVEILAEGPESRVKSLEKWCHTGSPKSKVTGVEVKDETPAPKKVKKQDGDDKVEEEERVVQTRVFSSFDVRK